MNTKEWQEGYAAGFLECFNQMRESTQPLTIAWAARDENGELHLFQTQPEKCNSENGNGQWKLNWDGDLFKTMRIYDFGSLANVQWTDDKATVVQIKAVKK